MSTNQFHIASLNVRGINDRNKRTQIFQFFKESNFDLILLQETRTAFRNENSIRKEWHKKIIINSTRTENCSGGCMILINSNYVNVLDTILTPDGRCIAIDIKVNNFRYHVVNTYFPIDSSVKKSFILSLYPIVSSQYPVIWGGDFNLVLNALLDRYPSKSLQDDHSSDLEQIISSTFDMQDVCRKMYPSRRFFTFRRGLSKSRIDHFYINKNIHFDSYTQQDFASSVHDVISIRLLHQKTNLRGKGFWRNKTKVYGLENFITKFKDFWAQNLYENKKTFLWCLVAGNKISN